LFPADGDLRSHGAASFLDKALVRAGDVLVAMGKEELRIMLGV